MGIVGIRGKAVAIGSPIRNAYIDLRKMTLNIAAGPGLGGSESCPGRLLPSGGFPDGMAVVDGHVSRPDPPGIGFDGEADPCQPMLALSS